MKMTVWANNFIRTHSQIHPVEWGPTADANIIANWPNGKNLWFKSEGLHVQPGTWGKDAMGIKIREMLDTC